MQKTLWMISIAVLLLVGCVALLKANPGDLRARGLELLGDERRNEVIALTSRVTARQLDTADMMPIQHVGQNQLGVNTFLEQEVEVVKRRQTLRMIKDAGIGFVRQQFPWEDIEVPAKGLYWDEKFGHSSWDKYDNIVDLAQEYGLQLIVRLDLPPKWAHPGNLWPHTPPEKLEDYGDFVYTVVNRYKGKVKYYQLWNEPNLAIEWGSKPVDAQGYVELLRAGYARAKEADPNSVILSAALAPTIEDSWQAQTDPKYLQAMYDAGAKDCFDIMSVMAYGLRFGPDDRRLDLGDINFSRPMLIREIMVKNGDASKPIWASEMGWNAQPESVTAEPTFGRVSEELQARYTVRGLQRAAQEWPWMGVMNLWFFKRVDEREKDQPFYYFRMVEPDFAPRPVYVAVKEYGGSPPALQRGFSQEDHFALRYDGVWTTVSDPRASLGGQIMTQQAGGSLAVRFDGTGLKLVAPAGPSLASAFVSVDGRPEGANQLTRDGSGKAVLDLSNPKEAWQREIPVAAGLSPGVHLLELKTAGAFGLDGLIVDPGGTAMTIELLAPLALGGLLLGTAMGILLARRGRKR